MKKKMNNIRVSLVSKYKRVQILHVVNERWKYTKRHNNILLMSNDSTEPNRCK